MLKRIITGIILILAAYFWIYSTNDAVFEAGTLIIILVGGWEFGRFLTAKDESGVRKSDYLVQGLCALLSAGGMAFLLHGSTPLATLVPTLKTPLAVICNDAASNLFLYFASIWWLLVLFMFLKYSLGEKLIKSRVLRAIGGVLTLIPFGFGLYILRYQDGIASNVGSTCLLAVMILVWCADSGAYFTGKALGRHKMCPRISPNKTIEGLAGGLILSVAVFVGMYFLGLYGATYSANFWALFCAAVATTIISVFGDLIESMFKREAGIKDSGVIFPGHGGMLDRIDSLSAAIPVFVVVYALVENFTR